MNRENVHVMVVVVFFFHSSSSSEEEIVNSLQLNKHIGVLELR